MSDLFNPELYVSDVSVYYGSKCAVQNVSFDIQPGQLTAIIGNNGCGKTSLIRAVMNLVKHSGKCMLGELQPCGLHVFSYSSYQTFHIYSIY